MKFSTSSTDMQRVLGNVGGVIPTRSTLPILENFLFDLKKNKLSITATDLEISMTVSLDVQGINDGIVAIPAKRLFETVRSLPNVDLTFTAEPENNRVAMVTQSGEYKLAGESSDNYPSTPTFQHTDELEFQNDLIRRLIGKSIFAVSADELRPAMMGILFQISKKEIRTVATDGHRLVRLINTKFQPNKIERELVIPAKALNLVLKSVDEATTKLSLSEGHAMFSFNATVLITRLIEEKYPNYESVIPLDNNKSLMVDRNQLLSSVRRTSLYASSTTHQVRLSLKKNSVTVSAEDVDFGSEARETLTCEYTDDPMEIGFNSMYIIDVLSHIDTDEVVFKFSSPTRACIVQPATQQDGEDLLMLIMPVRLSA
jgi:DNA polymerase-3 subunit beta